MISLFSILKIALMVKLLLNKTKSEQQNEIKNNMVLGLKVLKTSSNPQMGSPYLMSMRKKICSDFTLKSLLVMSKIFVSTFSNTLFSLRQNVFYKMDWIIDIYTILTYK